MNKIEILEECEKMFSESTEEDLRKMGNLSDSTIHMMGTTIPFGDANRFCTMDGIREQIKNIDDKEVNGGIVWIISKFKTHNFSPITEIFTYWKPEN